MSVLNAEEIRAAPMPRLIQALQEAFRHRMRRPSAASCENAGPGLQLAIIVFDQFGPDLTRTDFNDVMLGLFEQIAGLDSLSHQHRVSGGARSVEGCEFDAFSSGSVGDGAVAASESEGDDADANLANETSLVLGKYLSPRLYVSYGISLAESINALKLRYSLNDHWTIKSEVGEARGADLVYTIEK